MINGWGEVLSVLYDHLEVLQSDASKATVNRAEKLANTVQAIEILEKDIASKDFVVTSSRMKTQRLNLALFYIAHSGYFDLEASRT